MKKTLYIAATLSVALLLAGCAGSTNCATPIATR